MKKNIILSAALMFFGLTAQAQTTITFDSAEPDYKAISVYDSWEESPFRAAEPVIDYEAVVVDNPDKEVDEVLGAAPNSTDKVVKLRRSRYGSNTFGLRIDLKEPIRATKQLQYIHIMAYLGEKPAASRMMVIGLGKRLEESWNWQTGEDEQFWATTTTAVQPEEGWQDVVVSFKGFSYSKEENATSGIDIHSLVIVPDVRSPHADAEDWYAYIDEIVVDNNPDKRFSTDKYALSFEKDANHTRSDRKLNSVGLTSAGVSYSSAAIAGKVYSDNVAKSAFSAKAGTEVQPTFNYGGNWMSGYVYVDWNNDGRFDYAVNDNGTPAEGSEIVSYNAALIGETWYKSDGTTRGDGNGIGQGVPKFTVPAGTEPGFYRMRYKVDWNNLNPAGGNTLISDGGNIADVVLDVHGDKVTVNASQLNGDIVLAADSRALQGYETDYGQPLKVKIVPAPGFVQYGFALRYGYNVNAAQQLDDNGNPNWIEVNVPYTEVAGDGTYTIPAEYMRGGQVSIKGDMQQEQLYTVKVVGLEGQGGVVYANIETTDDGTVRATQFFSAEQVQPIAVEDYDGTISLDGRVITVTYVRSALPCQQVNSLTELKNYKLYQIKNKNGQGYLAYNSTITDEYVSVRGVTNFANGNPNNEAVKAKYQEEVSAFDETTVWQIIEEEGKYYLYQPERNAYVTRSGRDYKFTTTKTALDGIRTNSGDHAGTFSFHAGGGYSDDSKYFACIANNENLMALRNWEWGATGSVMQIIENPNVYSLDYAVEITGHPDGTIVFEGADYAHGSTLTATEFLTAEDVVVKALPRTTYEMTFDKENHKITVTYTREEVEGQQVTSLAALKNYKLYQIKAKSGEGYLAYNSDITEEYISLRGVTNYSYNNLPSNTVAADKYREAVSAFDETTVWQIIEEEGKYYLYQPAKKAYVTRSGREYKFTTTKTALDGIRDNRDGTFSFHAGGGYSDASTNFACIVTNEPQTALRNWTWDDHGSVMQIIENPNVYLLDYAVEVLGAEEGGVIFEGTEYGDGKTLTATEFVQGADFTAAAVDGKISIVNVEGSTIYVSYFDTTTQFYTIKNHKGGYVSLNADYTDAKGNLKLTNSTAVADEKGFWAFIGNETDGYKIYNYTTGLHKVLGMTGSEAGARASMVPYNSVTHTTAFYGAIDLDNGEGSYIRLSKDGNNYWNYRGDYLALWNSASAYNTKDEGSRFYLTKVEVVGFSEVVTTQWDFTFNRTATSATKDAVTVTVATGREAVEGVEATILPNREYKAVSNRADVLCLNKNTGGSDCATAEDPNRYTLVITNNSDINYAFDYIEVSGLAVNGSGDFQPLNVDDRMRNFKVTYGNTSIGPKELYICKKDSIGGGGKVYPHGFGAKMLIPAHSYYTIEVEVYNITRDSNTLGNGCFYGLSKIALGNTTVSFGATGYATLYAPIALTIPEDVTAYTGTLNEDKTWLTLSDIKDGIIPKEHAVILKGTAGNKFTLEAATGDVDAIANDLKGQTSTIYLEDVNDDNNEAYTLQPNGEGGVVFMRYADDENSNLKLTGGKAYLMLSKSSAQSIGIRFEGTTDIEHSTLNPEPSTQIYDLMGRRVEAITKGGIYIVNGKKVIK